jgi:hypothetical protein
MTSVFLVGDGYTDLYGIFSTRELAQAWIDRQHDLQVARQRLKGQKEYRSGHTIDEWSVDDARDLYSLPVKA